MIDQCRSLILSWWIRLAFIWRSILIWLNSLTFKYLCLTQWNGLFINLSFNLCVWMLWFLNWSTNSILVDLLNLDSFFRLCSFWFQLPKPYGMLDRSLWINLVNSASAVHIWVLSRWFFLQLRSNSVWRIIDRRVFVLDFILKLLFKCVFRLHIPTFKRCAFVCLRVRTSLTPFILVFWIHFN